jgi:sulfate adenylyltransferase subunit 1 (EFTu-like GTPase family)
MLVKPNNQPHVEQEIDAMLCWFSDKRRLQAGDKVLLRHTTCEVKAIIKQIHYKVDVNTLHKVENEPELKLNEIGRVRIRVASPLFVDEYVRNRITGSLILVDPFTNETLAGGMIRLP